uniref:expansin-B15-like n=1 Tax=Erigeron canadensis TaxID=72917 RepID=UPI001CB9BD85|nr:expansin-B15-like [Erigeron canadensis]
MMVSTSFIVISILLLSNITSLYIVVATNTTGKGLATWYNDNSGSGSGAACGWEVDVINAPFKSMIAAGNKDIFLNGKGCGHCFQIFCSRKPQCSGRPINITVTDKCPGRCDDIAYHFDLSQIAYAKMAEPGKEQELIKFGQVDIQYKRVPCNYGSTKIAFKIDKKANPHWFATAIEYVNGDGAISRAEIAPNGTKNFSPMEIIWGAVWKKDIDPEKFKAPYSFKLISGDGKTVVASNVIPEKYAAGQKFTSTVNF